MITNYVQNTNHWKEWQKEYKYGVILIYPPEPHNSKITILRNKYSWAQSSQCDAHISLTVPLPRPLNNKYLKEIQEILSKEKTFIIKYGPIIKKPKYPGVVLDISSQNKLKKLTYKIELCSLFEGCTSRKYPFKAHMTIAEMLTMDQTQEIINELKNLPLKGEFELKYLSYSVPDEKFKFTERVKIFLNSK